MTFEEILDHAIAMLKRRRRVAYRTLQVQFNLEENALEALKDELLYAQQVARDEDGRVLVWTGGADATVLSQTSILGPKSDNRGSAIQWLTYSQTLEKANLRQNHAKAITANGLFVTAKPVLLDAVNGKTTA
jgi:hypothetical protein